MKLDFRNWLDDHPILRWILFYGITFGGLYLVGVAGAHFVSWTRRVFPSLSSWEVACGFILIPISILYFIFRSPSVDDYDDFGIQDMKLDFRNWLDDHPILRWILFYGITFGGLYLVGVAGAHFVSWTRRVFPSLSSGEASCGFLLILISILYIIFRSPGVGNYDDNEHY